MSLWKNCFLLAGGVVAGALLYEALVNDDDENDQTSVCEDKDEEEALSLDGLESFIEKVRQEAQLAMANCTSDDEREAVYAKVKESLQKMQAALTKKGESLIEKLQEEAAQEETPPVTFQEIEDTLKDLIGSLQNALGKH